MIETDIAVLGAGIAGSAAARALAQAGWRVALIDHKPIDQAGPRWINGVAPWTFDVAGVPRSTGAECGHGGAFVMCDADGARRVVVDPNPVWWVDMRMLGRRLRDDALAAGAVNLFEHRCVDVELDGERPIALQLEGPDGPARVAARLFVDAAGMGGRIRRAVPAFAPFCPKVPREQVCSAAQFVCKIEDIDGAKAFLRARDAKPGEVLSHSSVAGGFSIQNIQVDLEAGQVDLLTGAIAIPEHPTGAALVDDLRRQHPWIGEAVFGGSGALPLRRPYARLGAPGVALLGDAACQVYAAHGSGIGIGMIAARLLCDVIADAADPGDEAVTWAYSARFHRAWGPLLGAASLVQRMTQGLTPAQSSAVLKSGLITPTAAAATLDQQMPPMGPSELPKLARGALKAPALAARLLNHLRHLPGIRRHHRRYPLAVDVPALTAWDAWLARRLG